jgi:hypothetical protein
VDDGECPRLRGTAPTRFPPFPCGRHRCAHPVLRRTPLTGTKSQSQRNPHAKTRSEPVPFLPLSSPMSTDRRRRLPLSLVALSFSMTRVPWWRCEVVEQEAGTIGDLYAREEFGPRPHRRNRAGSPPDRAGIAGRLTTLGERVHQQ